MELNQPDWALRYGFFQMPGVAEWFHGRRPDFHVGPATGTGGDFWRSWGMMTELERRYKLDDHPGAIRLMAWLDEANFASFAVATAAAAGQPSASGHSRGSGITIPPAAFAYRYKYGFGLNWEQELAKNVGVFSRVGWNDGHEVAWTYTDANWSASLGVSVKGATWHRPDDTVGSVGVVSGASPEPDRIPEGGRHGHPQRRRQLDLQPGKGPGNLLRFSHREDRSLHDGLPVRGRPCVQRRPRPRVGFRGETPLGGVTADADTPPHPRPSDRRLPEVVDGFGTVLPPDRLGSGAVHVAHRYAPGILGHRLQELLPTSADSYEAQTDSVVGSRAVRLGEDMGGDQGGHCECGRCREEAATGDGGRRGRGVASI